MWSHEELLDIFNGATIIATPDRTDMKKINIPEDLRDYFKTDAYTWINEPGNNNKDIWSCANFKIKNTKSGHHKFTTRYPYSENADYIPISYHAKNTDFSFYFLSTILQYYIYFNNGSADIDGQVIGYSFINEIPYLSVRTAEGITNVEGKKVIGLSNQSRLINWITDPNSHLEDCLKTPTRVGDYVFYNTGPNFYFGIITRFTTKDSYKGLFSSEIKPHVGLSIIKTSTKRRGHKILSVDTDRLVQIGGDDGFEKSLRL